ERERHQQLPGPRGVHEYCVVRIPGQGTPLSLAPYMARAIFRYVFALSQETKEAEPGPLGVLRRVPLRRLEFRAGKFALADFFDMNPVGSDSHLQFLNWTVVNNGAWDFAADTRGYTYAAMLEYDSGACALRLAGMRDGTSLSHTPKSIRPSPSARITRAFAGIAGTTRLARHSSPTAYPGTIRNI